MFDFRTNLFFVFLAGVALSCWLWFQVTLQVKVAAEAWLEVHRAELLKPRWYRRPDFRDYIKPPQFERFELVGDTVPRFYTPPADRVAQYRVRLTLARGGEQVWVMRLEDKGTFLFTDYKPVLFLPAEHLRTPRRRAA
jgi:hypothetical protein